MDLSVWFPYTPKAARTKASTMTEHTETHGWADLLQQIKPFGETDFDAILEEAAGVLGFDGARLRHGKRTIGSYGQASEDSPIVLELPHSKRTFMVQHSAGFEKGPEVEALGVVLDLALTSPDRRSADNPVPLMNPMGNRDRLTDTIDRDGFIDHLEMEFAAGPSQAAVITLGIDALGVVNETLGHQAGNTVLSSTADRIRDTLRSVDVISRLGGDVFAIYCPNMGIEIATKLAARLQDAIARPIDVESNALRITASAGIALRARGERADMTLEHADTALQAAKRGAPGEVAIFDGVIRAKSEDRRELAAELVEALADNQLATAMEPIVHLPNGSVVGVEAHVLWNHPSRGEIDRAQFMDLAELIGRVDDVERAVIDFAIEQNLQRERKVRTGVNLSTSTLRDPHAISWVVERLQQDPTHKVLIEISESAVTAAEAIVVRHLGALRDAGAAIVLDDFGTSFASLRALHAFSFDGVKLHTSLLTEGTNARAAAVVKSMYASARAAGFDVIHTGVDTDDDLRLLMALGSAMHGDKGFYAQGAAVRARVTAAV